MSKERRLVSLRRPVPPARRAAYDALWAGVHAEATARGAHAWRFASSAREDLFLEFLEFAAGADPRPCDALSRLDAGFPGEAEEWAEIPHSTSSTDAA